MLAALALPLADAAEEGLHVILGMLIVGLIFIGVIALGETLHWQDGAAVVLMGMAIVSVLWPRRVSRVADTDRRSPAP